MDLETENLFLKQISMEYQADIFRQFSDNDVNKYLVDAEPFVSMEEAEELINWYTSPQPRSHHRWVIFRQTDGAFLGTCGYHNWDKNNNICEIGYDLYKDYWGKGYMTEALQEVIKFGFEKMGLNRIQGFIHTQNEKSLNVLFRLGFKQEGIIRDKHYFRGNYYDHFCLSLLKREWQESDEKDLFYHKDGFAEDRAALYPIILREYNPEYLAWFNEERDNLTRLIGAENIVRIRHIGSTSVPGLLAKPTIDILLEIADKTDTEKLMAALHEPEYICLNPPDMPTPPPHLMFLKGYTATGFAERVFHIHVRYKGDWDEPMFRDYLIAHPNTAAAYAKLKRGLFGEFEHNRDGYTYAKTAFIRSVMEKAKDEV
jgi:RimJ/RimL family protein N-acetyltransferase/GrpB-like predicted nucleotidyltransferase (UPF0157 family)